MPKISSHREDEEREFKRIFYCLLVLLVVNAFILSYFKKSEKKSPFPLRNGLLSKS